jgi:pilus assembly protein FimV
MLFSKTLYSDVEGGPVPSDMNSRTAHPVFARVGALAVLILGLTVTGAHAAGLGRLNVQSALGQPLRADVEVPSVNADEAPTLQVRLAPQSAFRQANLEFNPALTQLRFDLEARGDGSYVVHVTSAQPVNEPFLDLLLELTWSTGRVLREYTVLLDPPALKTAPEIVAPVAAQTQPVAPPAAPSVATPAPAPAESAPMAAAPAPIVPAPIAPAAPPPVAAAPAAAPPVQAAPKPAPAAARAKPAPIPAPAREAATAYQVKSGDTLGRIAMDNKAASVSLDQMLVALLKANPNAFINNNMNLLLAGRTLSMPSDSDVRSVDPADAHREVVAQSADFNAYRSRIAQAVAAAPAPAPAVPKAAAQGKVIAKVEDKSAPAKAGDQLKIAKADTAAATGTAAKTADEAQVRQRMLKEEQARAEALKKTNEKLAKELELASKAAALAQQQAKAKADAEQLKAEQVAAKAKAEADAAKARAEAVAAKAKLEADAAAAKAKAQTDAIKAKADAAAAAKARLDAEAAARAQAEADKLAAPTKKTTEKPVAEAVPVAPTPPANVAKAEPPKPAAPAASSEGLTDQLSSPMVLGGLGVVLVAGLLGINFYRKRKVEGSDQFKATTDGMRANSLFGATGGQSVDTSATSTFNSSFIPAASQLDSNEVDPVAEADVYIAYGREEQAEEILKEALRLQPERVGVRVKLLEIYSRRGDKAAFTTLAQDLHDRSGGAGEEWDRAAKLGRSLDPTNPLFSGGAPSAAEPAHGPITEFRMAAGTDPQPGQGTTLAPPPAPVERMTDLSTQPLTVEPTGRSTLQPSAATVLGMTSPTRQLTDSKLGGDTKLPLDTKAGPTTRGLEAMQSEQTKPAGATPVKSSSSAPTLPMEEAVKPLSGIDFGALDFDLGPTKHPTDGSSTLLMPVPEEHEASPSNATRAQETPTVPSIDLMFEPTSQSPRRAGAPTATGSVPMPEIDLNLPTLGPAGRTAPAPSSLEEALSRPTLLGAVGALPDEHATRMTTNTDQATVPLIDFDLSGTETTLSGRRTETQAGTPLASQMATKLDLARGYIDLGVKDGARELLEEVMRDGTREQRQQAVELIKMVEA